MASRAVKAFLEVNENIKKVIFVFFCESDAEVFEAENAFWNRKSTQEKNTGEEISIKLFY